MSWLQRAAIVQDCVVKKDFFVPIVNKDHNPLLDTKVSILNYELATRRRGRIA